MPCHVLAHGVVSEVDFICHHCGSSLRFVSSSQFMSSHIVSCHIFVSRHLLLAHAVKSVRTVFHSDHLIPFHIVSHSCQIVSCQISRSGHLYFPRLFLSSPLRALWLSGTYCTACVACVPNECRKGGGNRGCARPWACGSDTPRVAPRWGRPPSPRLGRGSRGTRRPVRQPPPRAARSRGNVQRQNCEVRSTVEVRQRARNHRAKENQTAHGILGDKATAELWGLVSAVSESSTL